MSKLSGIVFTVCMSLVIPVFTIKWFANKLKRYLPSLVGGISTICCLVLPNSGDMGSLIFVLWALIFGTMTFLTLLGIGIYNFSEFIRKKNEDPDVLKEEKEHITRIRYLTYLVIPIVLGVVVSFLYYAFFGYENYETEWYNQYPSFWMLMLLMGLIVGCYVSYKFYHKNVLLLFLLVIIMSLTYIGTTAYVENNYRFIMNDYYDKSNLKTFSGIIKYTWTPGNYISVYRIVGHDPDAYFYVEDGEGSDEKLKGSKQSRFQIYLVEYDNYVVIDWKKKKVVDRYQLYRDEEALIKEFASAGYSSSSIRYFNTDGMEYVVNNYDDAMIIVKVTLTESNNIKMVLGEAHE